MSSTLSPEVRRLAFSCVRLLEEEEGDVLADAGYEQVYFARKRNVVYLLMARFTRLLDRATCLSLQRPRISGSPVLTGLRFAGAL
jgi:hypothetical protein